MRKCRCLKLRNVKLINIRRIAVIERRAYEIALVSLEVEPDEREAYELFMEKRFGDLVDRRRAKNGDNEYMAWDMTLGWIVWQQRAGIHFSTMTQQEVK
ncbi:hypothetical protein GCD07_20620 [Shigella sonnei]|nr:hypothetical protein [Shigella sonnei]MDN1083996.1 hypothetical protein [Escherichia coli]